MPSSGGGTDVEGINKFLRDYQAARPQTSSLLSPGTYPNLDFGENASSQRESDADSRVADYGFQAWARNSKKSKPLHDSGDALGLENLGTKPSGSSQGGLKKDLEKAMWPGFPNDTEEYLPLGQIGAICRRETIYRELSRTFGEDSPNLDLYTDYVCGNEDESRQNENTSRKIFANLVLIDQLDKINDFVKAGIKDRHLPFRKEFPGDALFILVQGPKSEPVSCFNDWDPFDRKRFYISQWRLLSPYFDRAPDGSVGLYELDTQSIMPWVEIGEEKRGTFVHSENFGGFAKVKQVKIHADHHAFEAEMFAIKELFEDNDIPFTKEFRNLKRVETRDHLLPVLNDLWATDPLELKQRVSVNKDEDTDEHRTRKVITWLAGQLVGLTGKLGLGFLHDTPLQPNLAVQENEKLYGIHGDIKPHNILYFEQHQNGDDSGLGLFKISDFGLTGFHSALTRSRQPPTGPHSPTYRAPEYGMSEAYLSRKYDIWGLGCVLLQFLTWFINGPVDLRQFDEDRLNELDENNLNFKEDKFFKSIQSTGAGHKSSVESQFDNLQNKVTKGNYLYDCLELIRTKMLQIDVTQRADCKEVHKALDRYHARCLKDTKYATDVLSTFDEPTPNTSPPTPHNVPPIFISIHPREAHFEGHNGVNSDQASNTSAALTRSRDSSENDASRTEGTQVETTNGVSSDEESNISAAQNADRVSIDDNTSRIKHEEPADQVAPTFPDQDGLIPLANITETGKRRRRNKVKGAKNEWFMI
ncbi:hypothetical protein EKO27_g637 [Xylaria grammica]|uniref:Protein kinase domain-containing protein n=1 Tax=Xylaria grammica TaxID=363999 RepID=A0A439DJ23_9PEZI|nr:hypothetical protein EKO27_g637 [Xylaria grammica]